MTRFFLFKMREERGAFQMGLLKDVIINGSLMFVNCCCCGGGGCKRCCITGFVGNPCELLSMLFGKLVVVLLLAVGTGCLFTELENITGLYSRLS